MAIFRVVIVFIILIRFLFMLFCLFIMDNLFSTSYSGADRIFMKVSPSLKGFELAYKMRSSGSFVLRQLLDWQCWDLLNAVNRWH